MWSKSAKFLMVRWKVKGRRGFVFPVPVWVVNGFMEALAELAWVGEVVIKCIPLPQEKKAHGPMYWLKIISPCGIIEAAYNVIKDLNHYKGLDVVDVEAGNVWLKISLK